MSKTKYLISLLLIGMMVFGYVGRVQAGQLPASSFYGTVIFMSGDTGAPTSGSELKAYVPGVDLAVGTSVIGDYEPPTTGDGILDYAINVNGDDIATELVKEGGAEGDTITLKIGTRVVATATYASGTNVKYDIHPPSISEGDSVSKTISKNSTPTAFSLTLNAVDALTTDTFSWSIDTQATNGTASIPAPVTGVSKSVDYTPNTNYVGLDQFKVKVTDSQGGEDIITVNVTVTDTVTLTVAVVGNGTVTSDIGGINCPTTCSATFNPNTYVNLTATAGTGSHFVEWLEGDPLSFIGDASPLSVLLESTNRTITAKFTLNTITITGTVTDGTDPLESVSLDYGGSSPVETLSNGTYEISVPYGWTGTVTPTKTGYVFDPINRVYAAEITANQTNQDFTATQLKHSISLSVGWNLVSFNVVPLDSDTADILADLTTNYDLVYAWDASGVSAASGNWLKYDRLAAVPESNTLAELHENMGFWIRMTAADILDVYGSAYPTSTAITLSTAAGGWNLVGFPADNNLAMPAVLDSNGLGPDTTPLYTLVYGYRATDGTDPWELYDPAAPAYVNDLTQLEPGMGYWIKVSEAATWTVPYNPD